MSTTVDLTIGLNLEIGSVPVSLSAQVSTTPDQTVYTFDGCVQDAVINLGTFLSYVGQQFQVDVQLPPELNLQANIDYVAGQIIYTKPANGNPTTEVGISAQFELQYSNGGSPQTVTLNFYADTIATSGSTTPSYVFGASIETDLQFKNLPLVGDVPYFNQYTLKNIGFSYTKTDPSQSGPVSFNIPQVNSSPNPMYTRTDPGAKNASNYSISTQGDQTTFNLAQKGFSFTAGLMKEGSPTAAGNFSLPLSMPAAAAPPVGPAPYAPGQSSTPASPVHWININKTFGPVDLQKIGVNYNQCEATFGLSAGFSLGAFSLDLQGLTITFPLPLPGMPAGNTVAFGLDGLGMAFQRGNLNIGGAFLKSVQGGITNYYGEVVVQVGNFGFTALGGYAPAQNSQPASFFLYANLQAPLGGPPFLYVTGLAFGFGINRTLILPTIDTLPGYLLLPKNAPAQSSSPSGTIATVMPQMASIFQNQPGQYWVAAGIQFTSFEMISAFALLTVSFGVDMQIGILGTCAISLPKGASSPIAYIEIDMVASFTPSSGLLQVLGVVSPSSYVMGNFVKLTGGFAFCIWFSGEHQGDFVVTIGGYNPAYTTRPAWYPNVPRMGMSFGLGPFHATGTAYLALTPSMFMAGMQFTATWSAGPVSAWFSAGVDFLVTWAPFTYQANAYVNVGCSVDLGLFTIHAHVGANLQVWGPSFGGEAEVDLDVCSFTIHFGSSAPVAAPISWQNLEENFLPPPPSSPQAKARMNAPHMMMAGAPLAAQAPTQTTANVSASASIGTLGSNVTSQDGEIWNWVLDPNNFVIVTATSIPANNAYWVNSPTVQTAIPNDTTKYNLPVVNVSTLPYLSFTPGANPLTPPLVWNPAISVKPMNLSNAQTTHTVQLCKRNTGDPIGTFNNYLTTFTLTPILQGSNTALWGDPTLNADATNPELLPNTLLGFTITPLPRNPLTVNNVPLITLLYTQDNNVYFAWTSSQPSTVYTVTSSIDTAFDLLINVSGQTLTNQGYVLSSLIDTNVTGRRNAVLNDLTANGFQTLVPTAVDLNAMGTTEVLTDWPTIGILGGTINP